MRERRPGRRSLVFITIPLLWASCFSLHLAKGQDPTDSADGSESCGEAVSRKSSHIEVVRGGSDESKRLSIVNRLLALDENAPGGAGRDSVIRIVREQLLYVVLPHATGRVLILKNANGEDVGYLAYVDDGGSARVHRLCVPGVSVLERNSNQALLMASLVEKLQSGELDSLEFNFDVPVLTSDISHFIERLGLRHLDTRETAEPNVWSLTRASLGRSEKQSGSTVEVFQPVFTGSVVESFPPEHIEATVGAYARSIQLHSPSYQWLLKDLEAALRKPGVFFLLTRGEELVAVAVGEEARAGKLVVSELIWLRNTPNRDSALTALLWEILRHADHFALDTQIKILGWYAHLADEMGLYIESEENRGQVGISWKTYEYWP